LGKCCGGWSRGRISQPEQQQPDRKDRRRFLIPGTAQRSEAKGRSVKKIVVIGTGRMGGAFATAFAKRTSHAVSICGSHAGSSSAAALSRQLGVPMVDDKELLSADVVFVATPPATLDDVAATLKDYTGIIVSAMVPGAGGYELKRDDGTSAAEQLARLVPKGRVVTAFTSISSALIRDPASGEKPTVFTCADDEAARSTAIALAKEIGFEGVDSGPSRRWVDRWMPNLIHYNILDRGGHFAAWEQPALHAKEIRDCFAKVR
jgi:predicted dinucleotide-binding enzyme